MPDVKMTYECSDTGIMLILKNYLLTAVVYYECVIEHNLLWHKHSSLNAKTWRKNQFVSFIKIF